MMDSQSTLIDLPPLKITEKRFKNRRKDSVTNVSEENSSQGSSNALHQSILDGRLNSLNYFLKMGFNVNSRDKFGRTCLMLACLSDHEVYGLQVAQLLFKYGADINVKDTLGRSVVYICISENRERMFNYLLDKHSTQLDFKQIDNDGNVLLNHVAAHGTAHMLRKVIARMKEKGLDLDKRNYAGSTALLLAIQNDRFLNAYILLKSGDCSTTVKDNDKRLNAIEWLLNRIESNKDFFLNKNPQEQNINSDRLAAHRSSFVTNSSMTFCNSVDSFASKNSNAVVKRRQRHKQVPTIDLKQLEMIAKNQSNMAPLSTPRSIRNNQYFSIENFCEHTPKINHSVDHHNSRFMPLVPVLIKSNPNLKATPPATTTVIASSANEDSVGSLPNLVKPNEPLFSESKKDLTESSNFERKTPESYPEDNLSIKEVVKKLYDMLYDRMLQANRPKRNLMVENKAAVNVVEKPSNEKNHRKNSKKKTEKHQKEPEPSFTFDPNVAQVNADNNKEEEEIAKKENKKINDYENKMELSLDKEIFDLEKLRRTPKLIAMQKKRSRNLSVKDSLHGLLNFYETDLIMGFSIRPKIVENDETLEINWSDPNNPITETAPSRNMSVQQQNNAKN